MKVFKKELLTSFFAGLELSLSVSQNLVYLDYKSNNVEIWALKHSLEPEFPNNSEVSK